MNAKGPSVATSLFADVTAITRARRPGRFDGQVDPEWTIADKPNGGYLLAMLGRATTSLGPHKDVISASAHYLRSPDPGPVLIEARGPPGRTVGQPDPGPDGARTAGPASRRW